jgi:hypothetical protein
LHKKFHCTKKLVSKYGYFTVIQTDKSPFRNPLDIRVSLPYRKTGHCFKQIKVRHKKVADLKFPQIFRINLFCKDIALWVYVRPCLGRFFDKSRSIEMSLAFNRLLITFKCDPPTTSMQMRHLAQKYTPTRKIGL